MPSSIFRSVRNRILDRLIWAVRRPNRIDAAAVVHPTAGITASRLYGPVEVEEGARIHHAEISGEVRIGRYSSLWGPGIHVLTRIHPVVFGNFCSVARNVSVHGYFHDARRISTHFIGRNILGRPLEEEITAKGPVRIGHDVWIGAGVHIMSGVSIGNGAVIGAGSVVTRDVPPFAIAAGVPAEVVRFRFPEEVRRRIEEAAWWSWPVEEIRARQELFVQPVTVELLDRFGDAPQCEG